MGKIKAVIEEASIRDICDLLGIKSKELKFHNPDAIVIKAKKEDGKTINEVFYFCLKPDGTFNNELENGDRARLASFLNYYGITQNVGEYNLKERIMEWSGTTVEVEMDGSIYIP